MMKHKTKFPTTAITIFVAASFISGGIFFILFKSETQHLVSFCISEIAALALASVLLWLLGKRNSRPHEILKTKIRLIGAGHLNERIDLDKEKMFSDIAESVNFAGEQLSNKLQSIIRNTNRLSDVEEELASFFRPRNSADEYTRDLVCQLKICTSRLKNDLSDFSISGEKSEENRNGRQ